MNPLVKELPKHSKFNELLNSIKNKEKDLSITGLTDASKAHVIYSLYKHAPSCCVSKCYICQKNYTRYEVLYR